MILRAIREIINIIVWRFIFNSISRINFITLITDFTAHLQAMSMVNITLFFRDLILNRYNFIFRLMASIPGINTNELANTNSKKIFWLSFVFSLILYRQYIFFKKLILWPFKVGIYSFFYAISGIDLSWLLSWFDYFPINIPQWVYIQYLNLYCNWLNWWKDTVEIKNLKPDSIPKTNNNYTGLTDTPADHSWISKKNIIIGATVIAMIGVGVLYFFLF